MKSVIFIFVLLVLAVGGYLFLQGSSAPAPTPTAPEVLTYENSAYSISFEYPNSYVLEEREVGNGERYQYAITLMDRVAFENIPQNGEGPTAITIDIFQNNLDQLSVEEWVRGNSNSNFKISFDGTLASTTVAGVPALSYTWDGLYVGDSAVFAHKGNIIMASVTYMTPDDDIRNDFLELLSSIDLYGGTEEQP